MLYLNAAEYLQAYVCGLGRLLPLLSPLLFARTIFLISLRYLFSLARISLFFCISVQILYDIHSDIWNVLCFLFRSSFAKNLLVVLVMRSPNHYYFTTRRFLFTKVFYLPPVKLGVFSTHKCSKNRKARLLPCGEGCACRAINNFPL